MRLNAFAAFRRLGDGDADCAGGQLVAAGLRRDFNIQVGALGDGNFVFRDALAGPCDILASQRDLAGFGLILRNGYREDSGFSANRSCVNLVAFLGRHRNEGHIGSSEINAAFVLLDVEGHRFGGRRQILQVGVLITVSGRFGQINSIFAVAFSQFVDGGLNGGIDYAAVVAVNDSHAGALSVVLEYNRGEAGSVTETILL